MTRPCRVGTGCRFAWAGHQEVDAEVAGPHVVAGADDVGGRVVGLQQRGGGVVAEHEIGVMAGQGVEVLVDLQDAFARLVRHAPERGARIAHPRHDQVEVARRNDGHDADHPEPVDAVFVNRVRRRRDVETRWRQRGHAGSSVSWSQSVTTGTRSPTRQRSS